MFSKLAATFLSTVGASSAPVVAIIVYYQIKKNSLELEPVSAFKNKNDDDETILSSQEQKEIDKKTEVSPTEKTEEKAPQPEKNVVTPSSPPVEASQTDDVSETEIAVTTTVPKTSTSSSDKKDELKKPLTDEELQALLKKLMSNNEDSTEPKDQKADMENNLNVYLESFVQLLDNKKNTVSDTKEKEQISEVVDALKKIQTKIT